MTPLEPGAGAGEETRAEDGWCWDCGRPSFSVNGGGEPHCEDRAPNTGWGRCYRTPIAFQEAADGPRWSLALREGRKLRERTWVRSGLYGHRGDELAAGLPVGWWGRR